MSPSLARSARSANIQQWSLLQLTKQTFQEWSEDRASHLAAALAYYGVFSLAPLVVLTLAIAGFVFGQDAARSELVNQAQIYSRSQIIADLVQSIADNARRPGSSLVAAAVGVIGLLYGATGVFNELKASMNQIWDAPAPSSTGIKYVVLSRLLSVLMVIASGLVLTVSLLLGTVLISMGHWINIFLPNLPFGNEVVNFIIFLIVTIPVFMLTYKYIPDVYIGWRDVTTGAIATAILFSIGRFLITLYLARTTATTAYGTAASLAVLLLWVYYSAQVFFLGAEFTKVYARAFGSRHIESEDLPDPHVAQESARPTPRPRAGRRLMGSIASVAVAFVVVGILSVFGTVDPAISRRGRRPGNSKAPEGMGPE